MYRFFCCIENVIQVFDFGLHHCGKLNFCRLKRFQQVNITDCFLVDVT